MATPGDRQHDDVFSLLSKLTRPCAGSFFYSLPRCFPDVPYAPGSYGFELRLNRQFTHIRLCGPSDQNMTWHDRHRRSLSNLFSNLVEKWVLSLHRFTVSVVTPAALAICARVSPRFRASAIYSSLCRRTSGCTARPGPWRTGGVRDSCSAQYWNKSGWSIFPSCQRGLFYPCIVNQFRPWWSIHFVNE